MEKFKFKLQSQCGCLIYFNKLKLKNDKGYNNFFYQIFILQITNYHIYFNYIKEFCNFYLSKS